MNINEYQAKELFRQFGVPVPRGFLAYSLSKQSSLCADAMPRSCC